MWTLLGGRPLRLTACRRATGPASACRLVRVFLWHSRPSAPPAGGHSLAAESPAALMQPRLGTATRPAASRSRAPLLLLPPPPCCHVICRSPPSTPYRLHPTLTYSVLQPLFHRGAIQSWNRADPKQRLGCRRSLFVFVFSSTLFCVLPSFGR